MRRPDVGRRPLRGLGPVEGGPIVVWHTMAHTMGANSAKSTGTYGAGLRAIMNRFRVAPVLLVVATLGACSGKVESESPADSGSASKSTKADADGGNAGVSVVASEAGGESDDASGDFDSTATCAELSNEAESAVSTAIMAATGNLACTTDSDCAIGPSGTDCTISCGGPIILASGAPALQAAIDKANATACAAFKRNGCTPPFPPPCPSGPRGAACVSGTCTDFLTAAWVSFALDQQPAGSGLSTPASCTPGTGCTLWTVTPDARIAVTNSQGMHQATLSAADFSTVDGLMRSVALRQALETGFDCDASPGGPVFSFQDQRAMGEEGMDVTGCIAAGPAGNAPLALYDVVKAY
jgi:hypothetical protein